MNSAIKLRAIESQQVSSTRIRELAIRQVDQALTNVHKLDEELAVLRERLRTMRHSLAIGTPAGSIGCSGGADLDMRASQIARAQDRLMVLIDMAYSAEEGVSV